MTIVTAIVAIVALLVIGAFLSAAETVVTRVDVVRALRLDDEDERGAGTLLELVEHPVEPLNALLFLTVTARVAAAGIVTAVALARGTWATAGALGTLVLVSFVTAEVVPRAYALRNLERVALRLAPLIAGLSRLVAPFARGVGSLGRMIGSRARTDPFSTDEQLRRLGVDSEADEVDIEADERAMIHSIFELGDTVCREIMVPRPDMVTVSVDDSFTTVVETSVTSGYSRIPAVSGSEDRAEVVGVVYAKDLLERLHEVEGDVAAQESWVDLVREPTFVPELKRADDLLRDLQAQKVHLAIVVDEYGAVAGLVTIEDILEEIVGEIVDEYDTEEAPIVRLDDERLSVNGRVTVHDLNEMIGADLPEDEAWDTVGGLVVGLLGHVPEPGEAAAVNDLTLVAERVQGRRVNRVLITSTESPQTDAGDVRRPEEVR